MATVTERIPAVTAHIGGAAPIEELVTTTLYRFKTRRTVSNLRIS